MLHRALTLLEMAVLPMVAQIGGPAFRPAIPKVWDDEAMREVKLPLAAQIPMHHMPSENYHRIPVRPNVKTYPI